MNATESVSLLDLPQFDPSDFKQRWDKARVSALRQVLGDLAREETSEFALLKRVKESDRDLILKKVFDYSRALGRSVTGYLGVSWELSDFSLALPRMGSPCFSNPWQSHHESLVLRRNGCSQVSELGSFVCDYWREALDGLVMGAGTEERLARHRSYGHGDEDCVDVLFDEAMSRRFGDISGEMTEKLASTLDFFSAQGIKITLKGLSEGVLYYLMESNKGPLCGAGGRLMHESFQKDVLKHFPKILVKDASPVAVYGEGT